LAAINAGAYGFGDLFIVAADYGLLRHLVPLLDRGLGGVVE